MTVVERVPRLQKVLIPCPVCGARDHIVTYQPWVDEPDPVKLYGPDPGIAGTQRLVTCQICGLLHENPRFPAEIINRGYAASVDTGYDDQHLARAQNFLGALRRLRRHLPPHGANVLDVGTAGGAFLEAAKAFGYNATGLEPSRFLVAKGRERGLQIEQGTIEKYNGAPGDLDMVCLWNVLEHIPEPYTTLSHIRALLKPDGLLLINYRNVDTWQARFVGKQFQRLHSTHLQHFSAAAVQTICDRTGFEILRSVPFWQTATLGHLQRVAILLKIPLAKAFERYTPAAMRRIPIPYCASQTTVLARLA